MTDPSIQKELAAIQDRNRRVEMDKAWELSWTRRIFIAVVTYMFATLWIIAISDTKPFLKALIPTAGYILSTITLPPLKQWWGRNK